MRRGWLLMAIGLLALALSAPAVRGQTKARRTGMKQPTTEPTTVARRSRDMQRTCSARRLDLGIWTMVVFLLLLFVLGKFAWKPMLEGLEQREEAIHAALEEAQAGPRGGRESARRVAGANAPRPTIEARADPRRGPPRRRAHHGGDDGRGPEGNPGRTRAAAARDRNAHATRRCRHSGRRRPSWPRWSPAKVIRRQLDHDDHRQLVDEAWPSCVRPATAERQLTPWCNASEQ